MKKYRIKGGYILRKIAGENTIIPTDPNSDISNGLLLPNESATMLWMAFEQVCSMEEATAQLTKSFEVSDDVAEEATMRFVNELVHYRIMEEVEQQQEDLGL